MTPNPSQNVRVLDVVTLSTWLERSSQTNPIFLVDVRDEHELSGGHIPGATHIPLNTLRHRAADLIPDREILIVVYCATGSRGIRAAADLVELGYPNVAHMEGGFSSWKALAYPVTQAAKADHASQLTSEQQERYSRHLRLPDFGEELQRKLLNSKILLVGIGGLGTPAALYLAAAGVGTLGLVNADVVELSNLQRQVLYATSGVGLPKVDSATQVLTDLNRDVTTIPFKTRLDRGNIDSIFSQGWDVVIDGSDNYPTRYLVNDASHFHDIPVIFGSVFRFEGRIMTVWPKRSPCYRCLFSEPPPAQLTQSCEAGGILGVLPGVIGVLQATEAIKVILNLGEPLLGRLLTYDALAMQFRTHYIPRNSGCRLCGDNPTIMTHADYESLCAPSHS